MNKSLMRHALKRLTGRPTATICALLVVLGLALSGQLAGTPGATRDTNARTAQAGPVHHGDDDLTTFRLPGGQVVTTHGGDGVEVAAAPTSGAGHTGAIQRRVHCVHDPSAPAFQVLYAYPLDHGNRLAGGIRAIRGAVRLANGIVYSSAQQTSSRWDVRLRVRCDARNRILVRTFPLAKRGDDASGETFPQIVTAGRAVGFRQPMTKYVVFWDSPVTGMCGQGEMHVDDRRTVNNGNNRGDTYSVVFGRSCWAGSAVLHEIGHAMGAVQDSAPHSTGLSHCNQEQDIMCYPDGGPAGRVSSMVVSCTGVAVFDCGHNDYFKVGRARGYLGTHWNAGWSKNRFLAFARR
jgi:hypothetical protein